MTRGPRRGRTWLLPDPPWAESMLAAPSAGRTALRSPAAGPGPGAGSLPPELSLPLAGPPPSPRFGAALPALSLPALALSSSALGSLTHCFPPLSPPSLSLSRQRRLPLPWGGSGHKGARLLLSPGSGPPLHTQEAPLQLFQLSNYREVEGKSLGPRSGSAASDPWQAGARGCSLDWVSSPQTRRGGCNCMAPCCL